MIDKNSDDFKRFHDISSYFRATMAKYARMDKMPIILNNGMKVNHAEFHAIEAIGNSPKINLTDLAEYLGITKSAASQTVSKLIKRQLVAKFKGENEKEIQLRLSDEGVSVFNKHRDFHNSNFNELYEMHQNASDEELAFLRKILDILNKKFDCHLSHKGTYCKECTYESGACFINKTL